MNNELFVLEHAKLRAFAFAVLGDWPDVGGIDGMIMQDIAEGAGLLIKKQRFAPCGEGCNCADAIGSDAAEWAAGVDCFRLADFVKAKP